MAVSVALVREEVLVDVNYEDTDDGYDDDAASVAREAHRTGSKEA